MSQERVIQLEQGFYKITKYNQCDILKGQDEVEKYGFCKNNTEKEMVELAIQNGSQIVTKNGKNGKWYIKGKEKTIEYLKNKLDEKLGTARTEDVYCLLIEELPEREVSNTSSETQVFLSSIGLSNYSDIFLENGFDTIESLFIMNKNEPSYWRVLKDLGLKDGPRIKIQYYLKYYSFPSSLDTILSSNTSPHIPREAIIRNE